MLLNVLDLKPASLGLASCSNVVDSLLKARNREASSCGVAWVERKKIGYDENNTELALTLPY